MGLVLKKEHGIGNADRMTCYAELDKAPVADTPFKIRRAIEYIEKNYTVPRLCLVDVARSIGMHRTSLSRLWHHSVDTSFPDFINELRVEHAKRLLLETTIHVSEVAHRTGFTARQFCFVFKNRVGMTPTQYRRNASRKC